MSLAYALHFGFLLPVLVVVTYLPCPLHVPAYIYVAFMSFMFLTHLKPNSSVFRPPETSKS